MTQDTVSGFPSETGLGLPGRERRGLSPGLGEPTEGPAGSQARLVWGGEAVESPVLGCSHQRGAPLASLHQIRPEQKGSGDTASEQCLGRRGWAWKAGCR